ncbi:glycosyltransferase [Owenweeksia hongkongensis]|uniref:glycosyltransferase n=1 Tax=Owenweeksia hongkongensis TaxID=253245 RepID=UPI003A8DDD76
MIIWMYPKLKSSGITNNMEHSISVLIPFRDEEGKLPALLNCLSAQVYSGKWEVIFINDHSSDNGAEWVEIFIQKVEVDNLRLIHSPKGIEGKKAALAEGIKYASGEVMVQTDGDCEMGEYWLQNLLNGLKENSEMVLGPVGMRPQQGFWSKFAALEFMSLQASGAAFTLGKKPIMGSAANMAYRKSVLANLKRSGQNLTSGDDVFMIQSLGKEDPQKVKFVLNEKAQTYTDAPANFGEFVNQRARWGSKTAAYPSKLAIVVAGLIGGISVLQCALIVLGFWQITYLVIFATVLFTKAIADYVLLRKYANLTKQTNLLGIFIPSSIIYPFYICITGMGMFFKTTWKGRTIQK